MIKKTEQFNEIYFIDDPETLNDKQMDNLLMCSTKNWNYYFSNSEKKLKNKISFEKIKNVELIEFSSKRDMFSFLEKLDKNYF
jgi:hypothetical protein